MIDLELANALSALHEVMTRLAEESDTTEYYAMGKTRYGGVLECKITKVPRIPMTKENKE